MFKKKIQKKLWLKKKLLNAESAENKNCQTLSSWELNRKIRPALKMNKFPYAKNGGENLVQ